MGFLIVFVWNGTLESGYLDFLMICGFGLAMRSDFVSLLIYTTVNIDDLKFFVFSNVFVQNTTSLSSKSSPENCD